MFLLAKTAAQPTVPCVSPLFTPNLNGSTPARMASPPLPATTTLSCGDSPLSTTSSIVGILTFALGVLASYIALQSATRGAPSEIARLVDDLRTTQHEINRVAEHIFDDTHNVPVRTSGMLASATPSYLIEDAQITARTTAMQGLYDEVQALLGNCVRLFYEADDLLKKSESDVSRWDPEGLRRRIMYVMNRHEVAEKMLRLEDQKHKLGDVRMSLFLRKSAMQDALLNQIAESVKEIQLREGIREHSRDSCATCVDR